MGKRNVHCESKAKTPEYAAWMKMRARCYGINSTQFKNYGARGIKVCERWDDYRDFLADMGRRPSPQHSLDRIDVNGNYEPGNCRWATKLEQANNQRNNNVLVLNGRRQTIAQWARELGIGQAALQRRHALGWSDHRTLTEPLRKWPSQRTA